MFLFKGRQQGPGQDLKQESMFNIDEIRDIVLSLPPGDDIIALDSGSGLLPVSRFDKEARNILEEKTGRIALAAFAERLDVPEHDIKSWLSRQNRPRWEAVDGSILTDSEMTKVAEQLTERAMTRFVDLQSFLEETAIKANIVTNDSWLNSWIEQCKYDEGDGRIPRDRLSESPDPPINIHELPIRYIATNKQNYIRIRASSLVLLAHTMSFENLRSEIRRDIERANRDLAVVEIAPHTPSIITKEVILIFATDCLRKHFSQPTPTGSLLVRDTEVIYVPLQVSTAALQNSVRPLLEHETSCLPLDSWERTFEIIPARFADLEEAVEWFKKSYKGTDDLPLKCHVLGGYLILDAYLDDRARAIAQVATSGRCLVDLKDSVDSFPPAIRDQVLGLMRSLVSRRLSPIAQVTLEDDLIVNEETLREIGRVGDAQLATLAENIIRSEPTPSSKTMIPDHLFDRFIADIVQQIYLVDDDLLRADSFNPRKMEALLQALWDRDAKLDEQGWASRTTEKLKKELEKLRQIQLQRFGAMWQSQVVAMPLLYSMGLSTIDEGPLKTQIAEATNETLTKVELPNAFKKLKQDPSWCDAVAKEGAKLEERLKTSKDLQTTMQHLDKCAQKLGLPLVLGVELPSANDPYKEVLADARKRRLLDALAKMESDVDAPRCFLRSVIILFATKRPGLLYATGKMAPKILKLLADELDAAVYEVMNEFKEQAKSGAVKEETMQKVLECLKVGLRSNGIEVLDTPPMT